MNALLEMVRQDFMLNVLAGTTIVAAMCSFLGVFIVLRRAVFVGAALAQVSSLGVALSFVTCGILGQWMGRHIHFPPQPFALALTLVAAVLMAAQYRERRLPRETLIGITYATAAGLAILLVATTAHVHAEVLNLLFGSVLTISGAGVAGLAALAVALGVVHGAFHKEFLFVSFDPDMAAAQGLPARLWNTALFLTVGVTISISTNSAGALVVFSLLVLPAATALLVGRNMRAVFVISVAVGVIGGLAGVSLSYVYDLPTGPTIVVVNAVMALIAFVSRWRS
jgi:zinc transport system permease protein